MVAYFTVFGSCAIRDIFNSKINKDYKRYFKIGEDGFRLTMISIMMDPVKYSDSIKIYPENKQNNKYSDWIKRDLEKRFLDALVENDFEYLLMDTYFDVNWGIYDIGNGNYITNNQHIEETEFFRNLKTKRHVNIYDDSEEFLALWKRSCDMFFKFMEENCPNTKIILSTNRHVHNYLSVDGIVKKSEKFQTQCDYYNHYRDMLDRYILENFDVDVLEFDSEVMLADEGHFWSVYSLHYTKDFFDAMNAQLNEIIERNEILSTPELEDYNAKIRKYKREAALAKIKKNERIQSLSKYSTARIDMKNIGQEDNRLEVLSNSDRNSREYRPDWLRDEEGEGAVIESYNESIDLEVKCINDGTFRISLKGLDVKDVNEERFPVFIDYTNVNINGEDLITRHTLTYHDKPIIFKRPVRNNDIVRIHIEWNPFSEESDYIEVSEVKRLQDLNAEMFKWNYPYRFKNKVLRNYHKIKDD